MTNELLNKVKEAKTPEELLKIAKENGMEDLTEENAKAYFETMHKSGEISDEELENAVGGCKTGDGRRVVSRGFVCTVKPPVGWKCKVCKQVEGKCTCGRSMVNDTENGLGISANFNKQGVCSTCDFCTYESARWICNNEKANSWDR